MPLVDKCLHLGYGNDFAFELACNYRDKMIEDLNKAGAGYTERHGNKLTLFNNHVIMASL
jgi:hypothetical protein